MNLNEVPILNFIYLDETTTIADHSCINPYFIDEENVAFPALREKLKQITTNV